MSRSVFTALKRQQFRRYFQPSRVLLGVVPAPNQSGVNIIALCFSMYCSYKPPMMAVAIHKRSATYSLIQKTEEYVLSVPGEELAHHTMFCGQNSMHAVDKVRHLNIGLVDSTAIAVPGLATAIANIEMAKTDQIVTGDHLTVFGQVKCFGVNTDCAQKPLVSLGPDVFGYTLLLKQGIHRLGIVGSRGSPKGGAG